LPQGKAPFTRLRLRRIPLWNFPGGNKPAARMVHNRPLKFAGSASLKIVLLPILLVSHSEQKRYSQALDPVREHVVLTVGETPEFLDAGGILTFSTHRSPSI